tara:strand:+ start:9013 stop:9654 length:642 start_codon:yes stop_codon:yes gene_type:complete
MPHIEKKIKFLATKLTSLQSELKVSREIISQAGKEVEDMFRKKYFPEIPVKPKELPKETGVDEFTGEEQPSKEKPSAENESGEIKSSADKKASPDVKRLFKKIASMTHPDKLAGLSEYETKKKKDLFKKAMSAMENDDLVSLADIAGDLEIETPEITKAKLKEAEQKIIAIKRELHQIESTYVWKWFFCEDEEIKDKILTELFEIMYANGNWS